MIPPTSQRVPMNTCDRVNQEIREATERRVNEFRNASPAAIARRLDEIDREWDTERTLEANAATLAFTGCVLAATSDRRWIVLPLAVTAFLFQHAVQGWCPPLPVLRRMGVRTMREIDEERMALKAIRGDFQTIQNSKVAQLSANSLIRMAKK